MFSLSLLHLSGISVNSSPSESWFWRVWGFCLKSSYTIYAFPSSPRISISKEGDNSHPLASRVSKSQDLAWQRYWNLGRSGLLCTANTCRQGSGDRYKMSHQSFGLELHSEWRTWHESVKSCILFTWDGLQKLESQVSTSKISKNFLYFHLKKKNTHLERLLLEAIGEYILM